MADAAGLSRAFVQRLITDGRLTSHGERVRARDPVRPGQVLELDVPEAAPDELVPEDIPLDVVYRDDDVIVVDKPAGLVTHPSPGHDRGTLVNALLHRVGTLAETGDPLRPGIVHRLDRETSGCLVLAKRHDHRFLFVVLVLYLAHDLIEQVLDGHEAGRAAVLVEHDGDVHATALERAQQIVHEHRLSTVCEESMCPNIGECWNAGTATIMVLGSVCTRACRFCAVDTGNPKGWLDPDEPANAARAVQLMGLEYVVITSVDRDDLPDGGAAHYAACVRAIKKLNPNTAVEALTPDFGGVMEHVETVVDSGLEVFAQNVETVERLTHPVRDPRAGYAQTLAVLAHAKAHRPGVLTKTSLMLGLGERDAEVLEAMDDLRKASVDILTLGQYLQARGYGRAFRDYYLVPMGAAIWSADTPVMMDFPLQFFVRFFRNHGLLSVRNRPQWRVIEGGSREYLRPLTAGFARKIRTSTRIRTVRRLPQGVPPAPGQRGQQRVGLRGFRIRVSRQCHPKNESPGQ